MEISITFNPAVDAHQTVASAVAAAFGVAALTVASVPLTQQQTGPMFTPGDVQTQAMAQVLSQPAGPAPLVQPGALAQPGTPAPLATPVVAGTALTVPGGTVSGVDLDKDGVPWDARIHSSGKDEATGLPKKTGKGVWNKRKGVDGVTYDTVMKELKTMMAAQIGNTVQTPLGNPTNNPHQVAVPLGTDPNAYGVAPLGVVAQPEPIQYAPDYTARNSAQFHQPASVTAPGSLTPPPVSAPMPGSEQQLAPPATLAPLAPINVAPPVPVDFPSLMMWLTPHFQTAQNPGGRLGQVHIDHVCKHFGLIDAAGNGSLQLAQSRPDLIAGIHAGFVTMLGG